MAAELDRLIAVGRGGDEGLEGLAAGLIGEVAERRELDVEVDFVAVVLEYLQRAQKERIEQVGTDDEDGRFCESADGTGGSRRVSGCSAGELLCGVRRNSGLAGQRVPKVALPALVVHRERVGLSLMGERDGATGTPRCGPVGAKAGIAIKLAGEELREGEAIAGREEFG